MSRGCGTNHSFRVKATAEGWPGIPLIGDVARVHFCSLQPTLSKTYKTSKSSRSVNPKRQLPDFPKSLFKTPTSTPAPTPTSTPPQPQETSTALRPWLSNSCGSTSSGWPKRNSTEPLRPSSSLGGLPPTFGS